MNPSDYRDRQRNFISAAEAKLKKQFKAQQETNAFMHLLTSITQDVVKLALPIMKSGGAVKDDDLQALREHVMQWTMDRLQRVDKETLRLIAGTYLAQAIMNEIEANPWGGASADEIAPS